MLIRSPARSPAPWGKLVSFGTAELAFDKPRRYRLALGPDAVGDLGAGAMASAA